MSNHFLNNNQQNISYWLKLWWPTRSADTSFLLGQIICLLYLSLSIFLFGIKVVKNFRYRSIGVYFPIHFFPEQTLDIIDKAHFTLLFYNTGMYIFGFIINWKIVIKIERNNLVDSRQINHKLFKSIITFISWFRILVNFILIFNKLQNMINRNRSA